MPTTAPELTRLVTELGCAAALYGQEAGKMSHFVYDVLATAGARLLAFNAHHLRMISASRKKSDRRDAYWLARALQTGMMPLREFCAHYDRERFHQELDGRLIQPSVTVSNDNGMNRCIQCRSRLGGLPNYYHREAA